MKTLPVLKDEDRRPLSAYTRFRTEFADELNEYSLRLKTSAPEFIVAISRKGPRLLQLMAEIPEVEPPDLSICVSEKALPFLGEDALRGLALTLTDDTIAYGSTFVRNHRLLEKAGARVTGQVMAMSKNASPNARRLLANEPLTLSEAGIHQLIDLEIQAFGALAVPYDIDHPIFTIPLQADAEELCSRLAQQWPEARCPTNPWHESHGVSVLSLPAPELVVANHSQARRRLGPQKLRLFFDREREAVRAVAIFAVALHETELHQEDVFDEAPEPIAAAWRSLLGRVEAGGWPSKNQNYALANAAHYLAGCEALWLWLGTVGLGLDHTQGRLSEFDLRLLFGSSAAAELHYPLQELLREPPSDTRPVLLQFPPEREHRLDIEKEIGEILRGDRGETFADRIPEYLAMAADYDPGDLIHSFFNAQRRTYDEETRTDEIEAERLSVGLLPFPVVIPMVQSFGAQASDADFDHFADLAIDGGSIVPHYTASLSSEGLWLRSVRAGERGPQKLKHWVYRCVTEIQRSYDWTHNLSGEHRQQGVPWYICEKVFAVLAAALEAELRIELGATVACSRDEFGARAGLPETPTEPFLLDWAMSLSLLERRRQQPILRGNGGQTTKGDVILPRAVFRELYPDDQDTVDRTVRQISSAIIDVFVAIDALFKGSRRDQAVLAISSCNTYDAYLRSLSAELQVWLNHRRFNAHRVALELRQLADDSTNRNLVRAVADDLRQSATAIAQTEVKLQAYRSRIAVRDEIDRICSEGERLSPSQITAWEDYIRPLIDDGEPSTHTAAKYLGHAGELAKKAVSVARTVLSEHGLAMSKSSGEHKVSEHVARFQKILETGAGKGLKYPQPRIDVEGLTSKDPGPALVAAAELLRETHESVAEIWEIWREPAQKAALDFIPESRSLLLWDIVGSSDQPEAVQETIHRVNNRVRDEAGRRGYASTVLDQDDGQAVVLPAAKDAFELFQIVAEMVAVEGFSIRAGIETTTDGRSLQLNRQTGQYGGAAYALTARAMTAFKEIAADGDRYTDWDSQHDLSEPSMSYVLATERTLKQLREREHIEDPSGLELYGVIRGYKPRVGESLSTDVSCFVKFDN